MLWCFLPFPHLITNANNSQLESVPSNKNPPFGGFLLLLLFLVDSRFLAPTAVLFEFDLALNKLLVLGAPIVDVLAIFAGEFEETILGHMR